MYVLYYEEQNYDGGSFAVIAVSNDPDRLEKRKQELAAGQKHNDGIRETHTKACTKEYKNRENQVRQFLNRNRDAIREFSMWSTVESPYDWHTTTYQPGSPYAEEVVNKKKDEIIDHVSKGFHLFYEPEKDMKTMNRLFFMDKLKEPLLKLECKQIPSPDLNLYVEGYDPEYMKIEEVIEL